MENFKKQKKNQPAIVKESSGSVKELSLSEVLARVDELLGEVATQEIINFELENYEAEVHSLIEQLNSIENQREKLDIDKSMETDEIIEKNIKSNLEDCMNKINEIKNDDAKKNITSSSFDWIPTDNSKKVVDHVVKKYVSSEVDSARRMNMLNSDIQKKDSLIEDLQNTKQKLKTSVAELQREIEHVKSENEKRVSNLEREWETKILLVLENHRQISEKAEEDNKSPAVKEIQNFEDEMWNKRNQLFDSFKEKEKLKKENEYLRQQLIEAEKKSELKSKSDEETERLNQNKENEELREQLNKAEMKSELKLKAEETERLNLKKENEKLREQLVEIISKHELNPDIETEHLKLKRENEKLREQLTEIKSEPELEPDVETEHPKLKRKSVQFSKQLAKEMKKSNLKFIEGTERLQLRKENQDLKEKLREAEKKAATIWPLDEPVYSGLAHENYTLREQLIKAEIKSELCKPDKETERQNLKREKVETCTDSDMIGAFLIDPDESVSSIHYDDTDKRDPDWRGTPLHLRRKTQMKRKLDVVSEDIVPQKRASIDCCSCPSECSTKRCSCKKRKRDCTGNCQCNNGILCHNTEQYRKSLKTSIAYDILV